MKRSFRVLCATITALSLSSPSFAAVGTTVVNLSFEQSFEAPRWMYDRKAKVKGGPLIALMVEAKRALLNKDRGHCLAALQKSYTLGKSLGPWLAWNQLQCAQLKDKKGGLSLEALQQAVNKVDAQPSWLLSGPSASLLRASYVGALLALGEQQSKVDRRRAWKTIDRLQQVRGWLSAEERANVYRWAGELAFIEQNLPAAQDFLSRSLSEKENPELRERMESIRSTLLGKKAPAAPTPQLVKANEDLGISDQEKEIAARMNRAYDSQDYVSAIEDGVELIQKFPGSRRATEASDRILDIYLSVSSKTDEKFRHVRESVVREMLKVDAARLARWANNAYARGNYLDALNLGERSYVKYAGQPESTKILLLAGRAALACGEYDDANAHFELLLKQHGGTPEAAEATFRLGVLQFRNKRYPQAAAYFERLLAYGATAKDFEYRALYWQWRAQQKIDKDKAAPFAEPLVAKYPLSYYGLRAQAELSGGQINLKNDAVAVKTEFRFLESERLAWERLNILLKAGWFKEAEKELESLPAAQSTDERLLRAKLWAAALRYDFAVQNINKALDDNPSLQQISVLKVVFPMEYATWIDRESKNQNLDQNWIRSLIRQESTFRPDARSSSNALGVMQLLPATAQEVARDLRIKDFQVPDSLYDPDVNIRLGSTYLARMVRNFNGNIPLALAAYNAGPTRLRRWMAARKDFAQLDSLRSSAPEVEIWMDELPWEETSFYVKAILRNWLIYRMLDGSKVSLGDPIWVDAKAVAR
jgi:soluble lytic murein transglycosylase